ncbi:hypothetical protein QBC34DRAFT_186115 [Podospora aff. communis PSN243]|uniref:Uncharacterized protein n=1 Tax=Podospora aff. communis PSN243 TaxID=3040156 RepID=A0AAV9G7Y8_9PEZI|nr:hypothetical protein QBC34DRAFT_186115 [Podospora aff. communis PSN243]
MLPSFRERNGALELHHGSCRLARASHPLTDIIDSHLQVRNVCDLTCPLSNQYVRSREVYTTGHLTYTAASRSSGRPATASSTTPLVSQRPCLSRTPSCLASSRLLRPALDHPSQLPSALRSEKKQPSRQSLKPALPVWLRRIDTLFCLFALARGGVARHAKRVGLWQLPDSVCAALPRLRWASSAAPCRSPGSLEGVPSGRVTGTFPSSSTLAAVMGSVLEVGARRGPGSASSYWARGV